MMRSMNSETVDLIATDPPFNKNRDFHVTPDKLGRGGGKFQDRWSWERDVHEDWVDQIKDDYPELMGAIQHARHTHSDGMGAFLCFMAVRLAEMRRILKDTGSIYLHCDPTASHYIKQVMDSIFGHKQFCNELIWSYHRFSRRGDAFAAMHDVIFLYRKGKAATFNKPTTEARDTKRYEKGYHSVTDRGVTKLLVYDKKKAAHKIAEALKLGRTIKYTKAKKPTMGTVWTDIPILNPASKERLRYPTQKPLPLYERMIEASSSPGGIVLDPFCGCATTLAAAESLGRQWVGIDIWDEAREQVVERFRQMRLETEEFPLEGNVEDLFPEGKIDYRLEPAVRTDDGEFAVPYLKPRARRANLSRGPRMTNRQMKEELVREFGKVCQGCFREYEDERIFELDHVNPRSGGGENDIWNRMLLCPPCNQIKGNKLTYQGLLEENRKQGNLVIPWKEAKERAKSVIARTPDMG